MRNSQMAEALRERERLNQESILLPLKQNSQMAEAEVSSAIKTIGKLLIDVWYIPPGIQDQAEYLQDMLKQIRWFWKDDEEDWVLEVRNIAEEATGVVESYILKVEPHRKGDFKNVLNRFPLNLIRHHKETLQIRDFNTRIIDLTKNLQELRTRARIQPSGSSGPKVKANCRDSQTELQKAFASSYSDMPYQIKPCFLYLTQYPKDTYLDVLILYQLWIAEGMIQMENMCCGSGHVSVMGIAETYLNTLVDMSMVQIRGDHLSVSRKFDSCRLHEMGRDFYFEEGRKSTSVRVVDLRGSSYDNLRTESAASRLVIYTNMGLDYVGSDKVARVADKELLSLQFYNTCEAKQLPQRITLSTNLLNKLEYLKSLVFESYKFVDHNNLEEVFNRLVHLRFLSFKDCDLDKLPSSVCSLPYLQTLDLRVQWGCPFKLPRGKWKTERLQYLFFSGSSVELVKGKLRLQGLSRLERIVNFQTDKMEVKDLEQLKHLRAVTAIVRDNKSLSFIVDHLQEVKKDLRVRYCDFKNASDFLRKVLECPQLFSLEILGALGDELPVVRDVACLTELVLVHSKINNDPMEKLKMIPNLQRLVLGNNAYLGKEMHFSEDGFPNLKSLCLTELPDLENLKVDEKAMPKLLRLVIKSCTKLKVPDGLGFLTTLKQLNTRSMPEDFNGSVLKLNRDLEECAFNLSTEK